jgi:hypothetical protein
MRPAKPSHVVLVVAVEERVAGIVGDEVDFRHRIAGMLMVSLTTPDTLFPATLVAFQDHRQFRGPRIRPAGDTTMGIYGAVSQDAISEFVPVMRFEPTPTQAPVRRLPSPLVEPSAVRHRQLKLAIGFCAHQVRREARCP